jgi:hypothetical protein
LEKTVPPLLSKILGDRDLPPDERLDPFTSLNDQGLNRSRIEVLEREFKSWLERQKVLSSLASEVASETAKPLKEQSRESLLQTLASYNLELPMLERRGRGVSPVFEEFMGFANPMLPLFPVDNPYPLIVYPSIRYAGVVENNFFDLSVKNALFSAIRLLAEAYAEDISRGQSHKGLTEKEVKNLMDDIRPLLEDLQILHPRSSSTVGEKRFLEGNLFTYSGDGINQRDKDDVETHLLTPAEGVELMAFMFSNAKLSAHVKEKILKKCPMPGGNYDVFKIPRIFRPCFRLHYANVVAESFHNAPGLTDYLKGLGYKSSKQLAFVDLLLESTKSWDEVNLVGQGPQWVEFTQMVTMSMILHYVEVIMTQYDSNEDGKIDREEARAIFPRFSGLIQWALEQEGVHKSEKDIEDIFLYILSYKSVPDNSGFSVLLTGPKYFYGKWWGWPVSLDRKGLLEAFNVIVNSGNPSD